MKIKRICLEIQLIFQYQKSAGLTYSLGSKLASSALKMSRSCIRVVCTIHCHKLITNHLDFLNMFLFLSSRIKTAIACIRAKESYLAFIRNCCWETPSSFALKKRNRFDLAWQTNLFPPPTPNCSPSMWYYANFKKINVWCCPGERE